MDPVRLIARSALGAIFISGGLETLRSPGPPAKMAAPVADKARETASFLPDDNEQLVRINGGVHVAAGSLLVLGKLPRISALVLAGSLIPTTLGGHRFWEAPDDEGKKMQQLQFTKNLAMFGGLIFAALDRKGNPSLGWRARRAARRLPVGSS
jgi:putative oxidoreductase